MAGKRHQQEQTGQQLQVDAGTQVLASFSSMQSPLEQLSETAFRNLLVVSTKSPAHVEQRLRDLGHPIENVGLIPLASAEHDYDGPLWTTDVVKPNDPTGLSIAVTNAMENLVSGVGWFLIEDLNVLSMYVDESVVCRLLTHLSNTARDENVRGVYGVVRSALSDESYGSYRDAVDTEIDCTQ